MSAVRGRTHYGLAACAAAAAFFGVLFFHVPASATEDLTQLRLDLTRIDAEHREETGPFDESERVLRVYDRAWAIIAEKATSWLREHTNASSDRLAAAIEHLSPAAAEQCRRDAWATDMKRCERETECAKHPPSFEDVDPFYDSCWSVDARAVRVSWDGESTYAAYVTFGRQGRVMLLSTRGVLPQFATLPRGPGGIRTLPDEAGGRHRFYVDARPDDEMPMGARACRQLQVFSWDGRTLKALLDTNYEVLKGTDVAWDGHALEVRTKGTIRSFGTCGACDDLDALWRIDVTPDAVRSRDLVYDQPLFPLVDEFITQVQDGADSHDSGSPRAAGALAAILQRRRCERPCAFGFVGTSVGRGERGTIVSLALDGEPRGTVRFAITETDSRPYIDDVTFEPVATRP